MVKVSFCFGVFFFVLFLFFSIAGKSNPGCIVSFTRIDFKVNMLGI